MRIRSNGMSKPSPLLRLLQRGVSGTRGTLHVDVTSDGHRYRFVCTNSRTLRRATTLLVKEAGTIRWLRNQAKPGRVFLDIGANVGIYSIFAGHHVGKAGHVFSVEPHLGNAVALMDNVMANQLQDQVSVLSMALSRSRSVIEFRYEEWDVGSAHSQLQNGDPMTAVPESVATELKASTSIDLLIEDKSIRRPDFIKIDVDGIELAILEGASGLLRSGDRPRSVQVECEPDTYAQIDEFMVDHGYRVVERHPNMSSAKKIAAGAAVEDLTHNTVFEPTKPTRPTRPS
jgi:FkbM family methyltransferase